MGKCTVAGGNPGMKAPVTFKPNFADNTWAAIIKACQTNTVPDTWVVGSQKPMTIGGTSYPIDIIGKNHDTYVSSGAASLTFQFHDCYTAIKRMNSSDTNSGGYAASEMHKIHLPEIKTLMPSEVKTAIKSVKKRSGIGGGSSSGTQEVDCELFLLSEIEVCGSTLSSFAGEGTQYEYYKAGNSKRKTRNGSSEGWWGRSPGKGYGNIFACIDSGGDADFRPASDGHGVAPGFCF